MRTVRRGNKTFERPTNLAERRSQKNPLGLRQEKSLKEKRREREKNAASVNIAVYNEAEVENQKRTKEKKQKESSILGS